MSHSSRCMRSSGRAECVPALAGLTGLVLGLASCSSDSAPQASFAVTDSAGVEVVATREPAWPEGGRSPWQLSLVTEIGELDGAEPYLFGGPVRAALLPDGRVAVADEQSGDIRIFSDDGEFEARWGQRGEGPGEFHGFAWLSVCSGQLMAYDWIQQRVTSFSFDGTLATTAQIETPEGQSPYRSRCLPDGSLLAAGWGDVSGRFEDGIYMFAQPADVWRMLPDTDSAVTLGTYTSSERMARIRDGGFGTVGPHPFGRAVVFAGAGNRIVVGAGERLQLELREMDGTLSKIVRGPDAELVIDDEFIEMYRSVELPEEDSADRATLAEGDFPMPPRYPAYSEVLIDDLDFIWVERFALPWSTEREWGVFDPDGVFLGHLTFPGNFRMTDIRRDRLVGVATDELGVIRVRVYALERGPAG